MKLFCGNSNPLLAQSIADCLGLELGKATVGRFSDGEISVKILENVRGSEAFVIQSICAPCNDNLMELLIMADALRRASAGSITAVVPYFGYARQDRRIRSARVPITAKVIADMFVSVGIKRVIVVDIHAEQIQGFFNIPVDNVYASPIMLTDMLTKGYHKATMVSPDVGGVMRARAFAKRLNDSELVIIDKRRPTANACEVMNVIGDVQDKDCIIVDDMIDTAGTLYKATALLLAHGANSVSAYCTHPVLSGKAIANIEQSDLKEVIVTDTIPLTDAALASSKIKQLGIGALLAQTISRVSQQQSVSSMFEET